HRLLCGDARDEFALASLLAGEQADALFTDPPYNVVIEGNVRKTGANRDFAMASGEMSEAEFRAWLLEALRPSAESCRDGAIAFICMDWRHMSDVLAAGAELFSELKNLCIWTKANGGQGSLYRSQHELIFVFKRGGAPHCNNVQLGKHGRNRTNIWRYAGVNGFRAGRSEELALHPTCKPVALVKDALMDVTRRNAIVLDCFGGSGSTLIAAHSCGRRARLLELDPLYCDVIVRRFERLTGKSATLQGSGETFEQICARRLKGGAE
ncbi:MAG: site-specific DNA-methyltransferase, partial [Hyphomonadaceae bacterium]